MEVNYNVKLTISGNATQNDYDDIDKIAKYIATLYNHECNLIEASWTSEGKVYSYKIESVEKYTWDEVWLSNMNPVNFFAGLNAEQCKRKSEETKIDVSDSLIDKILSDEIKIVETIS